MLQRETVALEDPGYRAAVATVRESGWEVRDLPALEPVTDLRGCVAAYVTPAHQHPLGRVMPAADRLTLMATARRDDALVAEDDYDSEFRYDVAPVRARSAAEVAGFRVNLLRDYCRSAWLNGLVVGFGGPTDDELERALAVLVSSLRS